MPLLWQEIIALGIVGTAVLLFLIRAIRRRHRKFSFERDLPCGCSNFGSKEKGTIVVSGKRGEPPRIRMKMK